MPGSACGDMEAELEHDMQGGEAFHAGTNATGTFARTGGLHDGECPCCEDEEAEGLDEEGGGSCCDEEDPLTAAKEEDMLASTDLEGEEVPAVDGMGDASQESVQPKKKARSTKISARSLSAGARLKALAQPRQAPPGPPTENPKPVQSPEKKPPTTRPSLLLRLRPANLQEAWEAFSESGFSEAPRFTYAFSDEYVTKHFTENSNVCFELMPEAERILQRVQDEYGGPEPFMERLYGEEKISAEDLRDIVAAYLQEHNVEDKVEIRIVDNMLAAANVVKPSPDEKYVVNLAKGPISRNMVQGICDHEVGTHLLRMMNDEYQVWHGRRDRYRLENPWTTEEGFATLNTYISMPCKLLYPQALRYWAVCRGAQLGFVELFHEIRGHVSDPKRCWQMCCRIKRGMIDTSQPGAFYMDQAYFKGAVEILRHLSEVDFGRLYGGQIALQDLDKVHFLLRKEVVRLPHFLNTPEKLKTYLAHCRRLIKENHIESAVERVCRPIFVRTAKELLKQKPKTELRATIAIAAPGPQASEGGHAQGRSLDLGRLESLARPRPLPTEAEAPEALVRRRDCDLVRLAELAMPRARAESEEVPVAHCSTGPRAMDLLRLQDLARPKQLVLEGRPVAEAANAEAGGSMPQREVNHTRLVELAVPRPRASSEAAAETSPGHPSRAGRAPRQTSRPCRSTSVMPPDGQSRPADPAADPGASNEEAANVSEGAESGEAAEAAGSLPLPRASRSRSRPRPAAVPPDVSTTPEPPNIPRALDEARLMALALPRKACEGELAGQPCPCLPKVRGKRRKQQSKLRLLALVQERRGRAEEEGAHGKPASTASPGRTSGAEAMSQERALSAEPHADDPSCLASGAGGDAPGPAEAPIAEHATPAPGAAGTPDTPLEPMQVCTRIGQRSQSVGPGTGTAGAPLVPPASPCIAGNATVRAASAHSFDPGLIAPRRPHASTSLVRPSSILPRAAMAAITSVAAGNEVPAWRAVPIKTMQFGL